MLPSPLGELVGQFVQHSVEGSLQLIKDGGHVLLQLLAAHFLIHFLQLYAKLLDVVHEDARLEKKRHGSQRSFVPKLQTLKI